MKGHAQSRRPMFDRRPALDWLREAACRTVDTERFYLPENSRGPSRRIHVERAKRVCRNCPVIAACLDWAIETNEVHGVWGGLDEDERDQLATIRAEQIA